MQDFKLTCPGGGLSTCPPSLCSSVSSTSPNRACCWYCSFRASTSSPANISAGVLEVEVVVELELVELELVEVLSGLVELQSLAGVELGCSRFGLVKEQLD